jgi:hypothetical protein
MKLVRTLALVLLAGVSFAQQPAEQILNTEVPARAGEICMACNRPIGAGDKCYLVEGQRVPVHRANCDDVVRANPLQFLAQLKPRGGLFGGEKAGGGGPISNAWLLAGLYVLAGLCFAAICSHRALNQGLSPSAWFFAGLFFTAPAYLVLLTRKPQATGVPPGLVKIPATAAPRACPKCGTTNHPLATRCLGCQAPLEPGAISEVSRLKPTLN